MLIPIGVDVRASEAARTMVTDELPIAAGALIEASRVLVAAPDMDEATGALVVLAKALRDAGDACDALAQRVIPDDLNGSICDRYGAAADAWPAPSRPTHERLAAILSTLHDTGAAARLTARRCDGAVSAIAATLGAGDAPH